MSLENRTVTQPTCPVAAYFYEYFTVRPTTGLAGPRHAERVDFNAGNRWAPHTYALEQDHKLRLGLRQLS